MFNVQCSMVNVTKVLHFQRAFSVCFRLLYVNAKFFCHIRHNVWWQFLGTGNQADSCQFLTERLAPSHQGLCGNSGTLRQLLFAHCLHIFRLRVED